ncbi:hypothetical protein [Odoribacter splanchnicus]|jgi:hypothetical protein|uniref:Uncharacterized protein n=3 Tax=Odoribacter splanchnicus TaxID=28118 RepID=A0AAW6FQ23_9BACT|nr:hypothetical protein [Odoribacter splanchnicus]DAO69650.1 MAG TPA: tail protein [Caudoviricetes sp.]MDB9211840.1 hypothetical protein [Odoribacter splanchnicus]MDB9224899.1 hypothetical protein [Odoribacter splanchnicus]MDB9227554.1 hypothetical protein [Odoribacter splanchnicus]MDB9238260.1 hypothetical protein [Odoribacter splanchnicus]
MTIVQQPDSLSFCGNLKDFIITGESEISFSLYLGSTILIAETYTAYNNKIIIPCKKVIEQQFTICLPDTDVFVQTRGVLDFNAHIGDTTVSFRVIKGGIGDAAEVATVFLKSQFLTLQPQQKQTLTWQPEFLNYYTQEQCRLKLRAYFADGTNEEKYIADLETGKLYTIDLSFLKINGKFEKQVGYYDAWIENTAGNRLTYIQRYILTHPKDNSQIYVFENTLGGLDSVCFTGLFSEKLETNGNITTINDESSDSDIDFSVIYEQNTGYIPTFEYIHWLRGFFLSCQRYHVTDSFRKIYIEESENTFKLTELNSYTFEFRYSLQSKYDFVIRNQEMLPELLEFPADNELFFLAPRLSEFPIAAIADDLVLPAQFSFENQWRRISIAAIIQAAISASIDATLDNIDLTDYWKKEELVRDELYLKFLDKKISSGYADKAGDSEKWNDKQMFELLDQPVRKEDSVQFKKVTTDEIISDNFVSGPLGEGMNLIRRDSSGKSYLEIDKIFARYKAVFAALEIRKLTYAGGNYIFSPAGATCTMVEDKEGFYRCYFTADDGEKAVENLFRTDDFVQCRESNIKSGTYENISNRYYWRRCIATGDDYIDLSKSDCDTDSDIPAIGDSMVTIGNKTVSARQNAIIISVYGEGSPSFIQYKGINSFSLEGKAKIIISPDQNRFTGKFTFETGEDAEESIKNISESAKEQGIIGGKEAIDNLQIGSQNLISKKMMLKWNEKNKDIAVWGQDADGVYLDIAHNLLYNIMGGDQKDIFDGSIRFKANTQYVFSVEWKVNITSASNGIYFIVYYTDGSKHDITLSGSQTTKKRVDYITEPNKTIDRISSSYGTAAIKTLLYNISLIEGNKPLRGFPVAEEDQTGSSNVNLADGTKGPFTIEAGADRYAFKKLYIPKIKPNTVYYVNAKNIEILYGNIDKCDFIFYNKSVSSWITTTYHHLYDKNGGVLITKNDFEAQEGYLLCYAGEAGATAGNSVRFTEVMLVEGFFPAQVWAPSFTEQQTGIDAANSAANAAQNAVMQVTKSLTELTAENGQIKASVKEVSQKVDTVKTDAEEFTLNNKGNGNNVATAITESFRIDGGYHILKLGVGKAGDIFTLSVETTKLVSAGSQAGKQMLIYTATSTASTYVLGRINATSSVKQIITFTLPQNMKDDIMICATEAWSGTNDVTKLKLEYGNKTTDWTPSTEDQNAITNKAKQEAIVTAASDATTKANNAKQQAITSAAADATNKADKAKQDAITSAAADATTKADAARNAAKSYTDDRTEPLWKGWIDASALDQTKYYPVVFYCEPGRRSTIRLEVALNSGVKPGWSTHASGFSVRCVWSVNGGGWGTTPINRIIDDFAYSFANVIPAGDVGQMTNSSREYIYVRGGGKYYFVATNTGTPFLVTSDYTASNQTISVKTSVTTPAITNATKTEVSSEIKVVKGLIEQKVAKTDYDKNNQVLNQSIGNLQTSYNSISGTVSSLNTRLQIVEKAGFITTSQGNTLYASKKLENGNELISYINQDATTFAVKANKIKLEGLVTANGNVQITTEGKIIAVNAEITGKITAGSGKIGGFNIYTDYIENNRFKLSDDMILFKNGTSKVVVGVNHKSLSGTSYQPLLYLFTPSLASNESCAYMECNGNILELCKRTEVINAKGTVTINGAVYFKNVTQAPSSNYYLCIDRSTGRLYYR